MMRSTPTPVKVLIISVVLTAVSGAASAEEEGWEPQPPMPNGFDWIQMTSEEWLKGELIAMYDGSLEFDSDEFDLQTVDWDDVKEVRTRGTMQIAFEDGTIAVGQLMIDRETVRVLGDEEQEFDRSGVLSITAGAPKEINFWSMKASIGANLREGNTEQIETTAKVNLIRRTPKNRSSSTTSRRTTKPTATPQPTTSGSTRAGTDTSRNVSTSRPPTASGTATRSSISPADTPSAPAPGTTSSTTARSAGTSTPAWPTRPPTSTRSRRARTIRRAPRR
jgi:hypothetical protein